MHGTHGVLRSWTAAKGFAAAVPDCVKQLLGLKVRVPPLPHSDFCVVASNIAQVVQQDGGFSPLQHLAQQTLDMVGSLALPKTCEMNVLFKK